MSSLNLPTTFTSLIGTLSDAQHGVRATALAHGLAQLSGAISTGQHGALGAIASAHAFADIASAISTAQHGALGAITNAHAYADISGTPAQLALGYGAGKALDGAGLTTVSAALSGDVTMTSAGIFYDGPSVSCVAGTWLLLSGVVITTAAGSPANCTAKLWDGTTVAASTEVTLILGGWPIGVCGGFLSVAAIVTPGGTTTYKISAAQQAAGGLIKAATPDYGAGNNASYMRAVRLA